MLLQLPHFPNVTEVAIHLEETALRAAFSRKTRPPLVLYLPSYFSTVNLLIKRPFFVSLIGHAYFFRPLSQERALLSKTCLRKALRQTRAGSYLRYSSLTSIKMDAPTQDLRNDLLSSGFRSPFVSRRLCAFSVA